MKKRRLYLYEIVEEPILSYPAWYILSTALAKDENLQESLRAIHTMNFEAYHYPRVSSEIFTTLQSGCYPIYKEHYVVGYFGGKVMYLESSGWKKMPLSKESFDMQNWLV